MTERELKKLGRTQLLEILLVQSRELDDLKKRMAEAEEKLKAREAVMAEADSLAQATAQLKELIESAKVLVEQLEWAGPDMERRNVISESEEGAVQKDPETKGETIRRSLAPKSEMKKETSLESLNSSLEMKKESNPENLSTTLKIKMDVPYYREQAGGSIE